jgi:hypothetical protein
MRINCPQNRNYDSHLLPSNRNAIAKNIILHLHNFHHVFNSTESWKTHLSHKSHRRRINLSSLIFFFVQKRFLFLKRLWLTKYNKESSFFYMRCRMELSFYFAAISLLNASRNSLNETWICVSNLFCIKYPKKTTLTPHLQQQ